MPEIPSSGAKIVDPAKSGEATVLEIPVTVQGSRCVEGKEQREIFTETTQTTIVFKNGAVLNLKSKVLAGQCVFLRNDKSGREVLCKVQESRPAGQGNYTDLIFTVHDPDFWSFQAEKSSAAAPKPDTQTKIDAAVASLNSALAPQSGAPAGEEATAAPSEKNSAMAAASALPEANEALPEQVTGNESIVANAASETNSTRAASDPNDLPDANDVPDPDDLKDAEHLASLFAMDSRSNASRETAAKEAKDAKQDAASEDAPALDEPDSNTAGEPDQPSTKEPVIRGFREFTPWKNSVTLRIAASFLIAAVLGGVAWHAKRVRANRSSNRASAAFFPSKQPAQTGLAQPNFAQPNNTQPSESAASAAAPGTSNNAVTSTPNAGNSNVVPAAGAPANTTAQSAPQRQQPANAANDSARPSVVSVEASIPGSDQAVLARPKHRKRNDSGSGENIPAKIVSQPQPSVPQWAKGLDSDAVVQLDALIDAKGNVTETRAISGPRMLQREAERVVALWIFEPAMADGKPTATHMVLTVQFQM
jgi:periplasmic protein TonB